MELSEVNTCYPAKIVSYDPVTQLARCKLQVEDYYTSYLTTYAKQEALLVDVPVMTMQAGGFMVTFPVKAGDDCLVLFAQKGYDHWLYSGSSETGLLDGTPTPEHYRAFSLMDGICIVGLRPITRAIPNYNPNDAEFRNESNSQKIVLREDGNIDILTSANVNITCGTANVKADLVNINAPTTKLTGNLEVSGTGKFGGDVTAAGVSVKNHTHTGNEGKPTSPPL